MKSYGEIIHLAAEYIYRLIKFPCVFSAMYYKMFQVYKMFLTTVQEILKIMLIVNNQKLFI